MSNLQAIVRKTVTVAATYTGIPSPEERKALKSAGAEFRNGQWVRTESENELLNGADVPKVFAATKKVAPAAAA